MTNIFISYAPEDRSDLEQCIRFLSPLVSNNTISTWSDCNIKAGEVHSVVIADNLAKADIVLILVSANYLASPEIFKGQFEEALKRQSKGEIKLIPVVLSACLWEDTPMKQFSVLPTRNKSIQDYSTPATAWNGVVSEIKKVLDTLNLTVQPLKSKKKPNLNSSLLNNKTPFENENKNITNHKFNQYGQIINEGKLFLDLINNRYPAYSGIVEINDEFQRIEKKFKSKRFQVAVLALIKSGKSTLLNACIGQEFLPANSQAETMCLVRIKHKQGEKKGLLIDGDIRKTGIESIREYIKTLNQDARDNKGNTRELTLEVELDIWKDKNLGEYQFDILDTPGVNESGVDSLFSTVEKLIKETDVIIYLLDFTKLKTIDEEKIFADIKKYRENLLADYKDRLFFVVNKFDLQDRHDRERQMDETKLKLHVQQLLAKHSIEIDSEKILILMAKRAFECRAIINNINTDEQLFDFKEWAYGFGNGSRKISQPVLNKKANNIIKQTGLSNLEESIFKTIHTKRASIFFKGISEDLRYWCDSVLNQLNTSLATLKSDKIEIDSLKERIDKVSTDINTLIKETEFYQKKTKNLIENKIDSLNKIIKDNIKNAFSIWGNLSVKKIFPDNLKSSIRFLEDNNNNTNNKDKTQMILRQVDLQIREQIRLEIKELWVEISRELYYKSEELSRKLTLKSKEISREIERVIGEELNIVLTPISIQIPSVTLNNYEQTFLNSLDNLIENRTFLFGFIKLPWLINWDIPFLLEDKYTFSKEKYRILLTNELVTPLIKSSQNLADKVIQEQMTNVLEEVQDNLSSYGNKYIQTIEGEILMKQQGNINIEDRIEILKTDIIKISSVVSNLNKISESSVTFR